MNKPFGVCQCQRWGYAPVGFDESKHFLKCSCGKVMYLHHTGKPSDAGYSNNYEIIPSFVSQ